MCHEPPVWRGSLLPLGRAAAPKMGLLRTDPPAAPSGAPSLATGYFSLVRSLKCQSPLKPFPAKNNISNCTVTECRSYAVAARHLGHYSPSVATQSATGLGGPTTKGATAPITRLQALFLCPLFCVMADCAGTPSGVPVPFVPVRQPCAIRHPNLLGGRRWRFPTRKESSP